VINDICPRTSVTLTANGGSLSPGASWVWYSGSCGGNLIGTGQTITVNPSITTTYFVRAEGGCNITSCTSETINVKSESSTPQSIGISRNDICPNTNVILTVVGGNLGTGASWKWYSDYCGGVPIGTGSSISVNPAFTSMYFVRAEGECNVTACASIQIVVKVLPVITTQPSNAIVELNQNSAISLKATGNNISYKWQSSSGSGGPWSDITGPPESGYNSAELSVQGLNQPGIKYYRCRIQSDCAELYSNIVSVSTVFSGIEFLSGNDIPDPSEKSIDPNLKVGYTKSDFNVSQTGAATMNIPIYVAPGTNGIQPSLSISYNSHMSYGLLGIGWTLSGLSSISRTVKPFYVDGNVRSVNLDESDSYSLDGNRLVLINDLPGFDGDEYLPEIEDFSKIKAKGTSGNGPSWFEVTLRNGSKIEYGHSSFSKIESQEGTALTWNISRVSDVFGNYCDFVYEKDAITGQTYLRKILYTGNTAANLNPYNEILFNYKRNASSNEIFYPGITIPQKLLLTGIKSSSEGVILRSYDFKYANNLYPHFVELVESGLNDEHLNSTQFEWGNLKSIYRIVDVNSAINADSSIIYTGDFNNDGRADIITTPMAITNTSFWKIFLGSSSGYRYLTQGNLDYNFKKFIISDGDNDGDDDIYWVSQNTVPYPCPPAGQNTLSGSMDNSISVPLVSGVNSNNSETNMSDGSCFADQVSFKFFSLIGQSLVHESSKDIICLPMPEVPEMYPADFDGNGQTDLIFLNSSRNVIKLTNVIYNAFPDLDSPDKFMLADFNANGKTDIITIHGSLINIFEYNGETHWFNKILSDYNVGDFTQIQTGDFNGDGKSDFLCRFDNNQIATIKVLYSTGNSLIAKNTSITVDLHTDPIPPDPQYITIIYRNTLDVLSSDLNSDGKSDILLSNCITRRTYSELHYFENNPTTTDSFFLSNGVNFIPQYPAYSVSDIHSFRQFDSNYDGNADLGIVVNHTFNNVVEFFPDDYSQLLVSTTDGRNLQLKFDYKLLNDTAVYYSGNTQPEFPITRIIPSMKVISSIKTYNNTTHSLIDNFSYKYSDLLLHRQGKGILGFSGQIELDSRTGRRIYSNYDYSDTSFISYPKSTLVSVNNHDITSVTNTQKVKSFNNSSRYLPYISVSVNRDILNNISVENTSTINADGYLEQRQVKYLDSGHNVIKQSTVSYTSYNSFRLPGSISILNSRAGESIGRSQIIQYDPVTGLPTNVVQSFGNSSSVTSAYDYDIFGNNSSVTQSSGTLTKTIKNVFDPVKGRFILYKIDPMNDTLAFTRNLFGNILTATNKAGLTTTYQYDEFGNLKMTTYPNGVVLNTLYNWTAPSDKELYSILNTSTRQPFSMEYYDIQGRKTRSGKQGFDGRWLWSSTHYDVSGKIDTIFKPYFERTTPDQYVKFTYDEYNRTLTESAFPGNITKSYDYDPLQVATHIAGQTYTKNYDATGMTINSTDPGGSIQYIYNPEDKVKNISSPSGTIAIGYDDYGYQNSLSDPDAGDISYVYNAFGELTSQTDAKGTLQQFTYDNAGRILTKSWSGGETITHNYDPVSRSLRSIVSSSGAKQRFEYDQFNRVHLRVDSLDNNNRFTAVYTYDDLTSKIENVLLNNSVSVDYNYNNFGYVQNVSIGNDALWIANSMNRYGIVNNFTFGNQATTSISFDSNGFVDGIATSRNDKFIQNWSYDFNPSTGNLNSRTGLTSGGNSITENFTFDDLNRLLTWNIGQRTDSICFDGSGTGNITRKTDVGNYNYTDKIHRVDEVSSPSSLMLSMPKQYIDYTKFNKVSCITDTLSSEEVRNLFFTYGPDQQRVKTVYNVDGRDIETNYYALDQYEKQVDSAGNVRELYYISGADGIVAMLEREAGHDSIYYVHKDHLGSFDVITDQNGVVVQRNSFNPWGRRRNPANWTYENIPDVMFTSRGFTGHEHLNQFNLINMDGRVYDPQMAIFLSPDNFIQAPDFTQNFNRYSYTFNNPLSFSDPTGNTIAPMETSGIDFWIWRSGGAGGRIGGSYSNFANGNGFNGKGLNGIYFDWSSNNYKNSQTGEIANFSLINSLKEQYTSEISWLYYGGTKDNPYQYLTGYSTSDNKRVFFHYNPYSDASGQEGGNSKVAWDVASTTMGVLGTGSDIAKESGYVTTIGTNLRPYASGWSGNQYVKTIGVAKGVSTATFWAGAGIDVALYFMKDPATGQRYQSGIKTLTNLGVSGTAMYIGGVPGIILGGGYMLIDKTVGWDRVMTPASNDQWVPNRAVFPDGTTILVCFKAGTTILAKVGAKPVEQIVVGDSVYSYNIEKNIVELSKVVKSFDRKTQEIYELTTDNQKIFVTAEHPFYVVGNGWVKVKDLKAGAVLKTKDGSIEHVTSSVLEKHPETVYNIEVEGNHNYFVTNSNILVHNK
jgi:RHS repeat-associated protein